MKAFLVYQAGIANVFQVDSLNLSPYGRNARRLLQHAFEPCYWFALGLAEGGWSVKTAGCNQAGDIAHAQWTEELDSLPFSDQFRIVSYTDGKPDGR